MRSDLKSFVALDDKNHYSSPSKQYQRKLFYGASLATYFQTNNGFHALIRSIGRLIVHFGEIHQCHTILPSSLYQEKLALSRDKQ
jgi:hypothetical protein